MFIEKLSQRKEKIDFQKKIGFDFLQISVYQDNNKQTYFSVRVKNYKKNIISRYSKGLRSLSIAIYPFISKQSYKKKYYSKLTYFDKKVRKVFEFFNIFALSSFYLDYF